MQVHRPSQLRIARWCRGLTLLQVQIETGIPATKLSLAERGLAQLSSCEQVLVANALSAPVRQLFQDRLGSAASKREVTA